MSIHGGKLPPGHASKAPAAERPRRASEKRQARETAPAAPHSAPPRPRDVFESQTARRGAATPARAEENHGTPSEVRRMVEAIAAHTRKLTGEFDALREQAQGLVSSLAEQGFSAASVGGAREELGDLRRKMAQLRGKIAADGRRLKLLKSSVQRLSEPKLADKLSDGLRRIADTERGWGRTFLALGIAGNLSALPGPEGRGGLRVDVGAVQDARGRHALSQQVAALAPGTAASQLLVALLEEGPHAPPPRLIAEAYAEIHADLLEGRQGKGLAGLGLWRQAMS